MISAMILAAGHSTRTRPLTDHIPKAVLPFFDSTILQAQLAYLSTFGIDRAAINIHHGRHALLHLIQTEQLPVQAFVEPTILGSGGGIRNMHGAIDGDDFIVLNSDVLCDIDLQRAVHFHQERKAMATMILNQNASLQRYGGVAVAQDKRVVGFSALTQTLPDYAEVGVFSGVYILNRSIFECFPQTESFCMVRDVLFGLTQKNAPVFGYIHTGRWHDLGEVNLYAHAVLDSLCTPWPWFPISEQRYTRSQRGGYIAATANMARDVHIDGPVWIGDGAKIASGCKIVGPCVICKRAVVENNCSIQRCLVFAGEQISAGTKLSNSILHDNGAKTTFDPLRGPT